MNKVSIAAPAKINLFLHITGKRADGFHLLDSLVVFSEFGDRLEVEPADSLSLEVQGRFAGAPARDDNLVWKAAKLLQSHLSQPRGARMVLHKEIPIGAGLGGGSADAAAALKALCELWQVALPPGIALQLGSDVPVCLERRSMHMRGIGEQLAPLAIGATPFIVLVNPGQPLATADVFRGFSGRYEAETNLPDIDSLPQLLEVISPLHNALEPAAIQAMPVIADILSALRATDGCVLARMSGSGATCFGLYVNEADAQAALARIAPHGWWAVATQMGQYGQAQ